MSKSLELDISLVRDKSTSTVLLCVAGLCVLLAFVLPVTWPVQLLPLAAAGFFLISAIYLTLRFRRDLRHSNRLYEMLRQAYFSRDRESFADRQEEIREYIKSRRWDEEYALYALYRFYRDFLQQAVSDMYLSMEEAGSLRTLEQVMPLNPKSVKAIRIWAFTLAFGDALADGILTTEEAKLILQVKSALALADDDVPEQMKALEKFRRQQSPSVNNDGGPACSGAEQSSL